VIHDGLPLAAFPLPPQGDEFTARFPSAKPGRYRLQVERQASGVASIENVSSPIWTAEPPPGNGDGNGGGGGDRSGDRDSDRSGDRDSDRGGNGDGSREAGSAGGLRDGAVGGRSSLDGLPFTGLDMRIPAALGLLMLLLGACLRARALRLAANRIAMRFLGS
jgi:hypothetical protein